MAKKKNKKVVRYRRPLNINVGMIILFIIFIYLVFGVYTYLKREEIQFYEIVDGGIVNNQIYNRLILHEEQIRTADRSGYINCCLRGGKRASVGSHVYSLDEAGNLGALLEENAEEGSSSSDNSLSSLKKQLTSFVLSFQNQGFGTICGAKISPDASMTEYSSFSTLGQLGKLAEQSRAVFEQTRSDVSGVIPYGIGSFESITTSDVEAASFDRNTYAKAVHKFGDLIDNGSLAYRVVTSEKRSIVFPLSEEDAALYNDKTVLRVIFRNYSLSAPTAYSTSTGKNGAACGKLDFSKYMEQFISDRSVGFEVEVDKVDDLKILISAITDENFYLIPLGYMTQNGNSSEDGFYKEVYTENGISIVSVPTTIYYSDEGFYYVDVGEKNGFKAGDYVVKPESSDRYQTGGTASLKGIYNINKGYTIFKQTDILDSDSEYYTVRKNMECGLPVYDHIVLDTSMIEGGQLLYQ